MLKRTSKREIKDKEDINLLAKSIVDNATGKPHKKNPAAVALGRLGGLKGGKARAIKLTKEERIEIATKAARARWRKEGKQ